MVKGMDIALETIRQDRNPLNEAFFSVSNMNSLQKELQTRVYRETNRLIDRQSEDDLFIIMRGIYVISSVNHFEDMKRQLQTLNEMVLSHIVPQVVFGVKAHSKFIQDVNNPVEPLDRGMYISSKGEKNNQLPVGV